MQDTPPPPPPKPTGRLIGKRKPDEDPEATQDLHLPQTSPSVPKSPGEDSTETRVADRTDAASSLGWLQKLRKPPPPIPDRLGQYEIRGKIAQGGMGVVLRGYHSDLKRDVAIKLLRAEIAADDDQATTRFMREARATAKLRHPGIVAIHDVGESDAGTPYLVMDFVRGEDLKAVIDRGPIQPRRAAELIKKVSEAVAHAHSHGILHRDLKPHNVLIDERTQEPLLTDFGLAKSFGMKSKAGNTSRVHRLNPDSDRDVQLTQAGEVMGTPLYMAPEQIDSESKPAGVKSDVYSLGAMLYECLTGAPPFLGDSIFDIFQAVLHDRPVSPRQLNAAVPADLEAICLRCLEKNPLSRYRTADELARDLARFLSGAPVLGNVQTSGKQALPAASWGRPLAFAVLALSVASFFAFAPQELRDRIARAGRALTGNDQPPPPPRQTQHLEPLSPSTRPSGLPSPDLAELRETRVAREVPLLREQAEGGDKGAMYRLGLLILQNEFTGQPPEVGVQWLEKALEAGHPDAARVLGLVHLQGIGVPADHQTATGWFREGAKAGNEECLIALVNVLLKAGTDDSYREAADLLTPLAESGNAQAQITLGDLHLSGNSWARPERSRQLWLAAAESDDPANLKAMMRLADHHKRQQEYEECFSWLRRAAKGGSADAMFALGQAYDFGSMDRSQDTARARKWYERARDLGHPQASERLSALDTRGQG